MAEKISWQEAQTLVLQTVKTTGAESVSLEDSFGRVLAENLTAAENVPAFDRSPYDGYAFRAEDTEKASPENPVTLRIIEEIPAGSISHIPVTAGAAVRLMTGAPIPEGADVICKFEDTVFTETDVMLQKPYKSGDNIIRAGEDVRAGEILAETGARIDTGLLGLLAAQNRTRPHVYRVPVVGILSTGSELVEPGTEPGPGQILNTNRFTIGSEVRRCGCRAEYFGIAGDDPEKIAEKIRKILTTCDALVMTGGVSVGKYDYTMQAMELAGAEILFNGVKIKPGMACTYGACGGKLLAGLSGNPASSLTNFHVITAPALRRLSGFKSVSHPAQHSIAGDKEQGSFLPEKVLLTVQNRFSKKSPQTRFLRGTLDLSGGKACIRLSEDQGNIILRSMAGSNVMAIVPAGSGPVEAGTVLEGFLI
ncbi:MAG: molybdopterin molybdotransferase MoeA [Eubacterium sp.]|nr:molybdopterin molybdotransferase MoeA [Eubacterium sp.]